MAFHISASAFDLQTVLDRLIESAVKLCAADMGGIVRKQDSLLEAMAYHGFTLAQQQSMTEHPIEIGPSSVSGRVMLEGRLGHVADVLADPEYKDLGAQQHMGFRTMLGTPLLRGGSTIGVLLLQRRTVRPCDLAHQAIALRPKLRVLYTTGNTITDKMKALLAEGTHFLLKPYTQNQLHDSVNNMLAA